MQSSILIPDSSFYICLLDDINCPNDLITILESEIFDIKIGPIIKEEIKKSNNYHRISEKIKNHTIEFSYYNYGEIIRPLLSIREISKGEHEVIVISFIHFYLNIRYITILDDKSPRNFIIYNYPDMEQFLMGTVKFLEYCTLECKMFSTITCIRMMNKIKQSNFRVPITIVEDAIKRIEEGSIGNYKD